MITIANDGQRLVETNYWTLPHAQRGLCYLTANAGALRLLVPVAAAQYLAEMRTGKSVTIEPSMQNPRCIDIVFEDGTDAPFFLALDKQQCDRAVTPGRAVPFIVYTEAGEQMRRAATIK